ncbi:MAG: hypothetical protein RI575_17890, partial [Balneolaceae bacterium]|nr:hypothetical protein [Balneolaceae bacterium]
MKQVDVAYIGLDLHATHSEFGVIDSTGLERQRHKLSTDPQIMNDWLDKLVANHKFLAVEEGPLT